MLVTYVLICCVPSVGDNSTMGPLTLFIFNCSVTWIVTYVSIAQSFRTVIMAGFLTSSIIIGIIIYSMKATSKTAEQTDDKSDGVDTSQDMRTYEAVVHMIGPFTVIAVILGFYFDFGMGLLYCVGGVVLFTMYLLVEIYLMVSGESNYDFSKPHAHIKASACIYLDVVSIFLCLVAMLSSD